MAILTKERLKELCPRTYTLSEKGKEQLIKNLDKRWDNPNYIEQMSAKVSKKKEEWWKKNKLPPIERFHKLYTIDEETGCWNWNSANSGYGIFWVDNENVNAHRWYWQYLKKQTLPSDLYVCHHCDNPPCVNPDHMFIGTNSDNQLDAIKKGRR